MDRQTPVVSTDNAHTPSGPRWGEAVSAGTVLFGRYTVIREIGRGGMGLVLLARDAELGIDIALKLIPDLLVHDDEALDDLKQEVLRGMTLTHPGIVRTHGFMRDESTAAIVMEYVDGGTFHDLKRMQPGGCFDTDELQPWIEQLAAALDYAHFDIQIAHRDLKPRNLMYTLSGRIKVADFGISSMIGDSMTRVTMKGPSSGTPAYMSPQQVMGERPSHLDDIYGLGATLYELLTGKPPFYKGEIVYQVLECEPVSMNARREELGVVGKPPVPDAWERVVAACLAKDPAARPQSAGEMVQWFSQPPVMQLAAQPESKPAVPAPAEVELSSAATRRPGRTGLKMWLPAAAVLAIAAIPLSLHFANKKNVPEAPDAPPLLMVSSAETLPAGIVGADYQHTFAATGGTPPYEWSLATGAWPAGIGLTADGRVLGKPQNAADTGFEIAVKDAAGRVTRQSHHLTISAPPVEAREPALPPPVVKPPPRILSQPLLPQGTAGVSYQFEFAADGGTPPFVWSLGGETLPEGLSLGSEGVLSGIPRNATTTSLAIKATDRTGAEAVLHASLTILPPPEPAAPRLTATKDKPFENSLGMRFVPAGTDGVLFSVWLTRVSDFSAFVAATKHDMRGRVLGIEKGGKAELQALGHTWDQPGFSQTSNHPVCAVSWDDAKSFCAWLTKEEHQSGMLPETFIYRLPYDAEWQRALFLEIPQDRPPRFPWGNGAPPRLGCNLAGNEIRNGEIPKDWKIIQGFRDNTPFPSPVDHYPANHYGLHDAYGNLWQFCEDASGPDGNRRLLRGGSWLTHDAGELTLAASFGRINTGRCVDAGFRCVIAESKP